jgi:hypothetical protein
VTTLAGSNPCAATASSHFCQYRWTSLAVLAATLRCGQGVEVRDLEGPEFQLVQELIEGRLLEGVGMSPSAEVVTGSAGTLA